MATYSLYVNKADGEILGDQVLVQPSTVTPNTSDWKKLSWPVEGGTTEDTFDYEGDENYAFISQIKNLLYIAFLPESTHSSSGAAHLFMKPVSKNADVHLFDPNVALVIDQTETVIDINADGVTALPVADITDEGAGTLTFKVSGILGSAAKDGTEIDLTISDLSSLFSANEVNDKRFTPRLYVFDDDGRKQVLKFTVNVLHPSTPVNSVLPAITGTASEGQTLTASTGTWANVNSNAITHTYEWLREGIIIAGATSATYVLTSEDVGSMVAVRVTASANAGTGDYIVSRSKRATSAETSAVA